ncbi:transcriptional regulator [Virgibacillus profundi]|uniref:Transcriptional regulator n=1 Tax=Virgibacillus profundi TaxID=2024555 RepID=A0A2A2IEU9_9BACI|nr:TetR/AcrR family transcriptional regulator [Virgibacillus profundi]PAV30541.1 transcriptional regulator [Virgibacillus profundi]PXY54713.1 TetR/AcrR family transcriptional regulator [Virgibacillus profundi]
MAPRISDEAKEERRLTLLDAALECFSVKGYYASTVDDIVSYSKLSKGSFYNYFESKEDIFINLLQLNKEETLQMLQTNLDKLNSPIEKLKYWINSDIPYDLKKKKMMRTHIEFWLYSTDSPDVQHILKDRFDVMFAMTKEIIAQGQQAGEFKQDIDPEKASAMFWALHDGIWLHVTIGYDEEKVEERIKEMEAAMLAYLT